MIRTLPAPKEPTFSPPTKKQVTVLIPPRISAPTPTAKISVKPQPTRLTTGSEVKPTKASALAATAPKSMPKSKAPAPSNIKGVVKEPALPADLSCTSEDEPLSGEEDDAASFEAIGLNTQEMERNEIKVLLVKKPHLTLTVKASLPPPHAYHPLTGEPLTGVLCVPLSAPLKRTPLLPPAELSSNSKGKPKAVAPSSPPVIFPPKQVHPSCSKKSPPRSSKSRRKAKSSPVPSEGLSYAVLSPSPMQTSSPTAKGNVHMVESDDKALPSMEADNVDNIIYVCAFQPQVDLQFHEPPLCQALEYMKLSMLPLAPDSLTKPPTQMHNGHEYVYRCHSDIDPHFIRPPLLTWPCYNCT
ncbi:hypothetical protein ARMGADRAFT_1035993 [Armillaria gallica]|uniref:Uncharacterized protein n=1 Tax=Armillaria gallica TaxID=47427 RepID=A0A2H3DC23_ARMGA|nr:hypothetical protein ARMGADRAFT_1035993 [Armillaria gallica]